MIEIKALYQMIYDDLKDADMQIEYAKEMKETNKSLADSFISNAKSRLSHAMEQHAKVVSIVQELKKNKDQDEDQVDYCLWGVTHKHYQDWYDSLDACIKKWK